MTSCLDSIKRFINNNVYTLFNKTDDYEYYLMKNMEDNNNLNENLMNENRNEVYQIFSIDDENMIKSIIEENNNLLRKCEVSIHKTNNKTENKKTNNKTENKKNFMTEKEVEEVLNSKNNLKSSFKEDVLNLDNSLFTPIQVD